MAYADTPQERFAKCWSDAMFGYANAAGAAYWAMADQAMSFWGEAARGMADATKSKPAAVESWYRPPQPVRTALLPAVMQPQPAWGFPRFDGAFPFGGHATASRSPFDLWFDMLPVQGSPAAWPMAVAMLSAGVPKSVAWPTAEANVAMMSAAEAAKETWNEVMSHAMPRQDSRARRTRSYS